MIDQNDLRELAYNIADALQNTFENPFTIRQRDSVAEVILEELNKKFNYPEYNNYN